MLLLKINSGPGNLLLLLGQQQLPFTWSLCIHTCSPSQIYLAKGNENDLFYTNKYDLSLLRLKLFNGLHCFQGKGKTLLCMTLNLPLHPPLLLLPQADVVLPAMGPRRAVPFPEMLFPRFFTPLAPGHPADLSPTASSENFFQTSLTRPNHLIYTVIATGDTPLTHITLTILHLCDNLIMVHLPHQIVSSIKAGSIWGFAHHDISRAQPNA